MSMRPMTRHRAMIRSLRARLQAHILQKLEEAQRVSGDSLGGIVNLIEYLGVDEVIRTLVDPEEVHRPPAGFVRLMENDLARCTIEQALIDFETSSLLTRLQIETALARLATYYRRTGHNQ
jgi:hypothetical protein